MLSFLKKIIIFILKFEAKFVLWRFKPEIIAITGSVGKTSAKEAIYAVLANFYSARRGIKSYNSEIGVPLTILGLKTAHFSFSGWLKNIFRGFAAIFSGNYPRILVLEYGVDRPKDMDKLLDIAKPEIAVITAIGEIPVHVEFFSGPEELAKEKSKLAANLRTSDILILNYDDLKTLDFQKLTKAKTITYGFGEGAKVRASNYRLMLKNEAGKIIPEGISFKVDYNGSNVPIRIFGAFGKPQVYTALAAIAVGAAKGLNLVEISQALTRYQVPAGRLKLIEGIKNTLILDDTYNASPLATNEALDLLKDLPAKRKIAVLGDMLELGEYAVKAHRLAGEKASGASDLIFTFGERAKFIAEEAKNFGFNPQKIFSFEHLDFQNAAKTLKSELEAGDLILVKGSQAMRMEKIVKEIMAYPHLAKEFLVRQDWKDA
jgi:UDP-N-acetylmuramoyl-tripeptide--D-alanyl-D-alanine ligase